MDSSDFMRDSEQVIHTSDVTNNKLRDTWGPIGATERDANNSA